MNQRRRNDNRRGREGDAEAAQVISGVALCDDDMINTAGENCDGPDLSRQTCLDHGFVSVAVLTALSVPGGVLNYVDSCRSLTVPLV